LVVTAVQYANFLVPELKAAINVGGRDQLERRLPRAGLVQEVLGEIRPHADGGPGRIANEGDGEEDEGAVGAEHGRLHGKVVHSHAGAMDAHIRDGRRVGEGERHLHDLPFARLRLSRRGVLAVGQVTDGIEEDTGAGVEGAGKVGYGRRT
jgi:hypothetical protein